MIYVIALSSLLFSLFLPWYAQIALAAAVFSFPSWSYQRMLKLCGGILLLHIGAAAVLDFRSGGLISLRFSGLLKLPHPFVFYLLSGLLPTLLFFVTALLIFQSRNFMRQKPKPTR